MQLRLYRFKKKHVRKDGTVSIGANRQWKWVKGETKQRKYRPRGQAKTLWSKRFGYLDTYTYNERKLLICPSGHTFGQGMYALHRLWSAYRISKSEANIEKMEHYARTIQEVQEDMGLKTSSFPHLGIYGDTLILYDHKSMTRDIKTEIDHSHMKEKQEMEEAKVRLEVDLIDVDELSAKTGIELADGESFVTIADEIPQLKYRYRIKHGNRMHYGKKRSEEWVCENCDEMVPANKNHICNHKEEGNVLTIPDDIPFEF